MFITIDRLKFCVFFVKQNKYRNASQKLGSNINFCAAPGETDKLLTGTEYVRLLA